MVEGATHIKLKQIFLTSFIQKFFSSSVCKRSKILQSLINKVFFIRHSYPNFIFNVYLRDTRKENFLSKNDPLSSQLATAFKTCLPKDESHSKFAGALQRENKLKTNKAAKVRTGNHIKN